MKLNVKGDVKSLIEDFEILSNRSREIDPRKEGTFVQQVVLDLKATMRANDYEYLCAPQIGYGVRIFCIRFGKDDYRSFINPIIENNSNFHLARETCYSLPNKTFIRPRFGKCNIIYMTPLGKIETRNIVGRSAVVFQHCIDHLDGLLLEDVGLEIDELFDNATDEEREEVIEAYMQALDLKQKNLHEVIKEDPELNQIEEASKFIQAVQNGEVQTESFTIPNLKPEDSSDNKSEET